MKKQTQINKKQKTVKDLQFLFWRDFQGQPQGCKSINPGLGTSAPPSGLFSWEVTQWHFHPFYPGPTTQTLSCLLSKTFKAVLPFWWSWFACLWTNETLLPVSSQEVSESVSAGRATFILSFHRHCTPCCLQNSTAHPFKTSLLQVPGHRGPLKCHIFL